MVEDYNRSLILFIRDLQAKYPRASPFDLQNECMAFTRRAWRRFEAIAALMPAEQGKAFMQIIHEEDSICSQEHHFHPDRFYRRLQLSARPSNKREQDRFYRKFGIDPAAVDAFVASPDAAQAPPIPIRSQPAAPTYHRQGIGEMAVRTAVRATIWELIFSLFRR
jgi:hypothetical protein